MPLSKLKSVSAFAMAASAALFCAHARAAVIVSNLSDTGGGFVDVGGGNGQIDAQEFVTGSQGATLGDVIVSLGFDGGTYDPQGELAANNNGFVGANITALNFPAAYSGNVSAALADNVTLTPATNVTLAPNTGYYVILSAGTGDVSGAYVWNSTGTTSSSFPNYAQSANDGSSWTYDETYGPQLLEVDSPAVPEPASLGILALGCIPLLRRRGRLSLFRHS